MRFRPCIDLRHGRVTQIVGSSLQSASASSTSDSATASFVSDKPASYYAALYASHSLSGGHVIMLGPGNDAAAEEALRAYPGGLQLGGGVDSSNAQRWLQAGASAVIVTSCLFTDGELSMERLQELVRLVGKERLVIDLSCRRKADSPAGAYYVVTNRWQSFSSLMLTVATLLSLAPYCHSFLIHGVDVEGKKQGVETELIAILGQAAAASAQSGTVLRVVYAGGVRDMADVQTVERLGCGLVDVSIGSALDIFGGELSFDEVVRYCSSSSSES